MRAGPLLPAKSPMSWSLSWRKVGQGEVSGGRVFCSLLPEQAEATNAGSSRKEKRMWSGGGGGAPKQVP